MQKWIFIVGLVAMAGTGAWAKYDPIWSQPELPQGWSPAQAAEYQGAQIEYSQTVRRHGEQSVQAVQARQRMIDLARALRADERESVPPKPHPGTFGTYAPPEAFEQPLNPVQ